jgi:hypothetical protein
MGGDFAETYNGILRNTSLFFYSKICCLGPLLQGEVHAPVAAIFLGMTRLDTFNADAESEPPDRPLAQVEQGVSRSEGNAVIAVDVGSHHSE